jgi:hypothetical protein
MTIMSGVGAIGAGAHDIKSTTLIKVAMSILVFIGPPAKVPPALLGYPTIMSTETSEPNHDPSSLRICQKPMYSPLAFGASICTTNACE